MTKRKRDKKLIKHVVIACVLVALTVAVAAFFILWDGADVLRKAVNFSGQWPEAFYYENAQGGRFGIVGDKFAVLTNSGVCLYDKKGREDSRVERPMQSPEMSSGGDSIAVWDVGGRDVVLFSKDEKIFRKETDGSIISATVNSKGYLALCTERTGYGGMVTVYDKNGQAVYRWSAGSAYLLRAVVIGDSRLLAVTVGSSGSRMVLMKLDSTDVSAEYTYDGLILDVGAGDNGIVAVTETELLFFTDSLEERSSYPFSQPYLNAYKLGTDRVSLLTGDYQGGGGQTLTSVDLQGVVLGTVTVEGQVKSLSMTKERTAILINDQAVVYDKGLSFIEEHTAAGAVSVLLTDDNSVIAAGNFSAVVFPESAKETE